MSWQDTFTEIGKILWVLFGWAWNIVMWGSDIVADKAGEGSRILFFLIIFAVIPFLAISWTIARSQAQIESTQALLTSFFFRVIVIGLVTFGILFILSQM